MLIRNIKRKNSWFYLFVILKSNFCVFLGSESFKKSIKENSNG